MSGDWYCEEVLSGQRPIGVVMETTNVLAFHHTMPSYRDAHVVVIPKAHIPSLLSDEAPAVLPGLFEVIREVAEGVVMEHDRCRIVTNLGSYQDSQHLHWHVVAGDRILDPVQTEAPPSWSPYKGRR